MNVHALRATESRRRESPWAGDDDAAGSWSAGSVTSDHRPTAPRLPSVLTPNVSVEQPARRGSDSSAGSSTGDSLIDRAAGPQAVTISRFQLQMAAPAGSTSAAVQQAAAQAAAAIDRAAREQAARHAAARARRAAEVEAVEAARRALEMRLMLARDTAALRQEEAAAAEFGGSAGLARALAEAQGRLQAAQQEAAADFEAREAAFAKEEQCWAARHKAAVAAFCALQRAATAEMQHLQAELGVGIECVTLGPPCPIVTAAAAAGAAAPASSTPSSHSSGVPASDSSGGTPPPSVLRRVITAPATVPAAVERPVPVPAPAPLPPLPPPSRSGGGAQSGSGGDSSGMLLHAQPQRPHPVAPPLPCLGSGAGDADGCSTADEEWHDCHDGSETAADQATLGEQKRARNRGRGRGPAGATGHARPRRSGAAAGCCTIM